MEEKGRFLKKYRGNTCLNCDVPLDITDRFCNYCGQTNTTKKLSFKDFFDEFFSSLISYDSRLRHTIIALLFSPGKISKDYIEGKRVRYANPFRFYLSVSIIFFIITGMLTDFGDVNYGSSGNKKENSALKFDFGENESKKEEANQITSIDSSQKTEPKTNLPKTYKDKYYSEQDLENMVFFDNLNKRYNLYQEYFRDTEIKNPSLGLDNLKHTNTSYHKWIYNKAVQSSDFEGNAEGIISFFISKLPFIIFLLLPVFALVIWLLYARRDFTYMEHLVFLFHTQTMFFVLLTIGILLDTAIFPNSEEDFLVGISLLVFLFYLYKAMRKFYGQRRWKTLVKFLILNQIFTILALIGIGLGFIISFALY